MPVPKCARFGAKKTKRLLWRQTWVSACQSSGRIWLCQPGSSRRYREPCGNDINIERALEIEAQIHHDLMAELRTYAEQCPSGGGVLHLGATSMDIEDNADAIRLRKAVDIVLIKLEELMGVIADKIETSRTHNCDGFHPLYSRQNQRPSGTGSLAMRKICWKIGIT